MREGVLTVFVTPLDGDAATCPSCRGHLAARSRTARTDLPTARAEQSRSTGIPAPESLHRPAGTRPIHRRCINKVKEKVSVPRPTKTALQLLLEEEEQALAKLRAAFPALIEEEVS